MRFLYFLLLFFAGLALVYYRERVQNFTGSIGFAEKYLGPGGTYSFYLLIGIAMSIGAILYITGSLEGLIEATIGRFFFRPASLQ